MFTLLSVLLLAACSSKEQTGLKEALTVKLQDDQDLKDYKLDPKEVAACVEKAISDGLPGIPGDPRRPQYYEAYAKFVSVNSPGDAEAAVQQYKDLFGGIKQAHEAANTITDHIMTCMGTAIEQHGGEREK
ncbi:hypothetical protein JWZ97_01705 [Methylococcus sp. EFPC2]|nr:hypothetical protein JWZ97_01705 [Methylococcus sp. EFPC2]